MTEAENMVVEEEISQVVDEPEAEEVVQKEPEQPKEDVNSVNWREARQSLKEQKRMIRELQEQLARKEQHSDPVVDSEAAELLKLQSDDLLTVAQARKLASLEAKKIVQEAMKNKDPAEVEERMRMKYADFDEVLSEENVEYLLKNEPTLVKSIKSNPDPVQQAEAAYRLAKKLCPEKNAEAEMNMKKIEENKAKPLSSSSVKKSSALDSAHLYSNDKILTKEGKEYYYNEMQKARRQPR